MHTRAGGRTDELQRAVTDERQTRLFRLRHGMTGGGYRFSVQIRGTNPKECHLSVYYMVTTTTTVTVVSTSTVAIAVAYRLIDWWLVVVVVDIVVMRTCLVQLQLTRPPIHSSSAASSIASANGRLAFAYVIREMGEITTTRHHTYLLGKDDVLSCSCSI